MKTSLALVCAAAISAFSNSPAWAQDVTASPAPSMEGSVAFYGGRAYIIQNGRALLIDATSVPNGQILTSAGQLVPMPMSVGASMLRTPPTPAQENTPPLNRSEIGTGGAIPPVPPAGGRSRPPRQGPQ